MGLLGGAFRGSKRNDLTQLMDCYPDRDREREDDLFASVFGGPKKQGFDWSRAAATFLGGHRVADMFEKRDAMRAELERQRARDMGGYDYTETGERAGMDGEARAMPRMGQGFGVPEATRDFPGFPSARPGTPKLGESPLNPGWMDEEEHERARRNGPFRYFSSPYA